MAIDKVHVTALPHDKYLQIYGVIVSLDNRARPSLNMPSRLNDSDLYVAIVSPIEIVFLPSETEKGIQTGKIESVYSFDLALQTAPNLPHDPRQKEEERRKSVVDKVLGIIKD